MISIDGFNSFSRMTHRLAKLFDEFGQRVDNGEWQAKTGTPFDQTFELTNVSLEWPIPSMLHELKAEVQPNLPWAEDHFQERVSGIPHNPPPSHEWWPFNQNANAEHRPDGEKFSHTYPERFWPKHAGEAPWKGYPAKAGIRFEYGDLTELIDLLITRPNTRQAYLPIWFPEDGWAARNGERVPCTLGYHFMIRDHKLSCRYYMRSCDFFRYFRDDAYMAARLTQHIVSEIVNYQMTSERGLDLNTPTLKPGNLVMHIANLHIFAPERESLKTMIAAHEGNDPLLKGGWF